MPKRKNVPSLEDFCAAKVGHFYTGICDNLVEKLHRTNKNLGFRLDELTIVLNDHIDLLRTLLINNIPAKFHSLILKSCLESFSKVYQDKYHIPPVKGRNQQRPLSPVSPTSAQNFDPREILSKGILFLKCLGVFSRSDLRILPLECRYSNEIHWKIVGTILENLHELQELRVLDIFGWNCSKLGFLSDHNRFEGWQFCFTKNLREVRASQVTEEFFENLCQNCPEIKVLKVSSSRITDAVIGWVTLLEKLEVVELQDSDGVTPIGFAKLLKSNPNLRSVGSFQNIGQSFYVLYNTKILHQSGLLEHQQQPMFLKLECIDTRKKMSEFELDLIVEHCPNLRSIKITYLPNDELRYPFVGANNGGGPRTVYAEENINIEHKSGEFPRHLAVLAEAQNLEELSVNSSDFYGHNLYQAIEVLGRKKLRILKLEDVDELNINAVLEIGEFCPNLKRLILERCHYQIQQGDSALVDKLVAADSTAFFHYKDLESLELTINTPVHLLLLKYIIGMAANLKHFKFRNLFPNFDDNLVRSFSTWNKFTHLEELEIVSGELLSMHTANFLIQKISSLKKLGHLANWGKCDSLQIESMKKEIHSRNLDLELF